MDSILVETGVGDLGPGLLGKSVSPCRGDRCPSSCWLEESDVKLSLVQPFLRVVTGPLGAGRSGGLVGRLV